MATSLSDAPPSGGLTAFKNRILVVRHGQSESNVQHVLVSDPKDGLSGYGLTEEGRRQAKEACHTLESLLKLPQGEEIAKKLVIVTSDFLRTLETAKIIHEHFQVIEPLRLNPALRERGFGSYHLSGESSAFGIFKRDYEDPTHRDSGCESLMDMVLRISKLLQSLDDEFNDRILLLVSHGDPIQALCAICSGFPPGERWTRLPNIGNCGIRELPNSCN